MPFKNQDKVPIFNALVKYSKSTANLHIPAHRQGLAAPKDLLDFVGEDIFKLDQTEIFGLDDLHNPQEVIAEAQSLAAELYGADCSFFLVNGTSCGLQALLMSVCSAGQKIILPRNMHRSVLAGLIFSGADPEYIMPEVIPQFNIAADFSPVKLSLLLKKFSEVKAVLEVYPNYYGVGGDLKVIAELVHAVEKPLLVDEAHGAHLAFHPALPSPALKLGADAVVQSTHKFGGALTQASMLHLKGRRLKPSRVAQALRLVQTTSPSYILMASLDTARRQMALRGSEMLESAINLATYTKNLLQEISGIKVLNPEYLEAAGTSVLDPTKLVINIRETGLNGYRIAELLALQYNVHVEMADSLNLIAVITIGTTKQDCLSLVQALKDIVQKEGQNIILEAEFIALTDLPPKAMTPREAWFAENKRLFLADARGKISAEWIAVYPPGIPVICPGEIITSEVIDYLLQVKAMGLHTQGIEDTSLTTVKVVAE